MVSKLEQRINNLFDQGRDLIRHEDDLVDKRLRWAITVSAFLSAAYGATWIGMPDGAIKDPKPISFVLSIVRLGLAVLGYFSSIIAAQSIQMAHLTIKAVARKYNNFVEENGQEILSSKLQVWQLIGDHVDELRGFYSSTFLPHGIACVWCGLAALEAFILTYMLGKKNDIANEYQIAAAAIITLLAILVIVRRYKAVKHSLERKKFSARESYSLRFSQKDVDQDSILWISEESFQQRICETDDGSAMRQNKGNSDV